jgi:hypothetical protein
LKSDGSVTLIQYFAAFKTSFAALAGLGIAPALLSRLIPDWSAYIFPPLGSIEPAARIGTVLLGVIVICCGYLIIDKPTIRPYIISASIVTAFCLVIYLAATTVYVRRIEIPSQNKAIFVSIGAKRSEFAIKEFGSESDWDILRERGPNEEEVYKLWTPQSIIWARLLLYLAYLGIVLGWTFCFSAFMALELSVKHRPRFPVDKTGVND